MLSAVDKLISLTGDDFVNKNGKHRIYHAGIWY